MKKRFLVILSILVCVCVYYAGLSLYVGYHYSLGKQYYDKQDYKSAYFPFKKIFKFKSKDYDYLYFYAFTLTKLPKILDVQEELVKVSQAIPMSSSSILAQSEIDKYKKNVLKKYSSSYIENVGYGSKVLRWNLSTSPLKIAFVHEHSQVPPYYPAMVMQAFNAWKKVFERKIDFTQVDKAENADIIVVFTDNLDETKCTEDDCKINTGLTTPKIENFKLKNMTISLKVLDQNSVPYPKNQIYNTALHEIGHALGIMGHSYNKSDVMYPVSEMKSYMKYLSSNDISTINLLYKIKPDITNLSYDKKQLAAFISSELVMGSEKARSNQKVMEAKRYLAAAPTARGWANLAEAYSEAGDYNKANQAYNTALSLAGYGERGNIYYNMAVSSYNAKNYDAAIDYAQKSLLYEKTEEAGELIGFAYLKTQQVDLAINQFKSLIERYPQNSNHYVNLATSYIIKLNFVEAGKTMNRLLEVKPDAKNEDNVKKYLILAFFFK